MKMKAVMAFLAVGNLALLSSSVFAVDADAAQALAKKEGCLKCHAIDKKKDASSMRDIGKKYAGKAEAQARLEQHLLSGEKVKLEDGTQEEHKIIKTKDKGELANLVAWILSLK